MIPSHGFCYPDFKIDEWDEFGENDLTRTVREMLDGQEPLDSDVVLLLLHDALFTHQVLNNARKMLNKYKEQNKGEK